MKNLTNNILILFFILYFVGLKPSVIMEKLDISNINILGFFDTTVIELSKPSDIAIERSKDVAKAFSRNYDRDRQNKMIIALDEFSKDVAEYMQTSQEMSSTELLDVFKKAFEEAFGKAENNVPEFSEYIRDNIFKKQKYVTQEEYKDFKDFIDGLAWNILELQ